MGCDVLFEHIWHAVWASPEALPSTGELADPDAWVARTQAIVHA